MKWGWGLGTLSHTQCLQKFHSPNQKVTPIFHKKMTFTAFLLVNFPKNPKKFSKTAPSAPFFPLFSPPSAAGPRCFYALLSPPPYRNPPPNAPLIYIYIYIYIYIFKNI